LVRVSPDLFPASLPDLSPYNVTVQSSPGPQPAQVCTIAKGAGQIAGANVGDVAVDCETKSLPVRVRVIGLGSGVSVTLQNHGDDDLVATSDGVWTFPSGQLSNTAIDVSISAQPGPIPSQICSVTAGDVAAVVADVPIELEVTCVTQSYVVSGTLANLPAGQSISVSYNGGAATPLVAGGPFALGTQLSGTAYSLSVIAQTALPNRCFVINAPGTVANAAIVVEVVCVDSIGTGAGATIGDGPGGCGAANVYGTAGTSDILSGAAGNIRAVGLEITGLNHTWIGDTRARIRHVSTGTERLIWSRIGADGSGTGCGSNADFSNASVAFADANASVVSSSASGSYRPFQFFNLATPTAFGGEAAAGTWRLLIDDNAGGDSGNFGGWTLWLVP